MKLNDVYSLEYISQYADDKKFIMTTTHIGVNQEINNSCVIYRDGTDRILTRFLLVNIKKGVNPTYYYQVVEMA